MSEVAYSETRVCPLHTHELAFFALLLEGTYSEQHGRTSLDYRGFRLGFHPAATSHIDAISAPQTRFLIIQMLPTWTGPLEVALDRQSPRLCNAHGSWLASMLHHRVIRGSDTALAVEAIVLEMIGTIVPTPQERRRPPWIFQLLDLLHAEFMEKLTVAGVARRMGFHPVYLSREFRKWSGQGVGDFVHHLRMCHALKRLRQPEAALSQIALEAGFSDQSQFTKVFRHYHGATPHRFRGTM